jgi:hypothetical protein
MPAEEVKGGYENDQSCLADISNAVVDAAGRAGSVIVSSNRCVPFMSSLAQL